MPILPDKTYQGFVDGAKLEVNENTGSRYMDISISVPEEGSIDTQLYFTAAAMFRTWEVLSELNPKIKPDTYRDTLLNPNSFLKGVPCRITTKSEDYTTKAGNVVTSVKVQWLNSVGKAGKPATDNDIESILSMSGATPRQEDEINDGLVPF